MGRITTFLLGLILLTFSCGRMEANDTLKLEQGFDKSVLGKELSVLRNADVSATVADVFQMEFESLSSPRPNLGFDKGALWVKTSIRNLAENSKYRFQIHQPLLDSVHVFVLDAQGEIINEKPSVETPSA